MRNGLRSALAIVVAGTSDAGCWFWCEDDRAVLADPGRADLSALLTALAALVLQVALTWLLLLTVLVALEPLAGRDLASYAGCPKVLRRTLLACCGAAAIGALAAPAQAAPATPIAPALLLDGPGSHLVHRAPHASRPADERASTVLDGLPLPERTVGGVRPTTAGASASSRSSATTVLVRRGDTLWDIAARHLPRAADQAEVARAADALYIDNRSLIGPDPDLIQPGTVLRLPPTPQQEDNR